MDKCRVYAPGDILGIYLIRIPFNSSGVLKFKKLMKKIFI